MKPFINNPRKITERSLKRLRDDLAALGDIGGIVENAADEATAPLTHGQLVGGHQRLRAMFGERSGEFALSDADIEIITQYDEPNEQGTIAEGFIRWRGNRYAYRRVVWDDDTFRRANFKANMPAGQWDWDIFANTIDADDIQAWGVGAMEWLDLVSKDISAVRELAASTFAYTPQMPQFAEKEFTDDDIANAEKLNPFEKRAESSQKNLIELICPECGSKFYFNPNSNNKYG